MVDLPAPFGPEQAEADPLGHVEVEVVHRGDLAEALDDLAVARWQAPAECMGPPRAGVSVGRPSSSRPVELERGRRDEHVLRGRVHVAEAALQRARGVDRAAAAELVAGVHHRWPRCAPRGWRPGARTAGPRCRSPAPCRGALVPALERVHQQPARGPQRRLGARDLRLHRGALGQPAAAALGGLRRRPARAGRPSRRARCPASRPRSPRPAARRAGRRTAPPPIRGDAPITAAERASGTRRPSTAMSWLPVPRRPGHGPGVDDLHLRAREEHEPRLHGPPRRSSVRQPPMSQSQNVAAAGEGPAPGHLEPVARHRHGASRAARTRRPPPRRAVPYTSRAASSSR